MRTTIEFDDKLIAKAMKQTGAKTKREAVHIALNALVKDTPDYLGVLAMFGSGAIDPDYDPKAGYGDRIAKLR